MKIAFIGAGNMAEAIVAGIVKQGVVAAPDVWVTDINEERLSHLNGKYGVSTSTNNAEATAIADVVVLAVKPQIFPVVWPEIEGALREESFVVSIMAGVPSVKIANGKPVRVVRVMPNTPSLIGAGAAGIAGGEFATQADLDIAVKLMSAVGVAAVVTEPEIDAVTALSGSGPAYALYLLESMLAAADQMDLDPAVSRELALATVIGAAQLMRETGETASELRTKVTSKGGTTAAATNTLDDLGVKDSIIAALLAAQSRSVEIANG